jgi:D-alanyl-D-alanine dipeptidase
MNTNNYAEVMNAFNTNVRVYCRRLDIEELATFFTENQETRSSIYRLVAKFGYDLTNVDHLGRTAAFLVALIIKLKIMQEDTPKGQVMMGKETCTNVAYVAVNIFRQINNTFNEDGNDLNVTQASNNLKGAKLIKGGIPAKEVFVMAEGFVKTYFTNRRKEKGSVSSVVLNQVRNGNDWDA